MDEDAIDLVKAEAIGIDCQQFVAEVIRKVKKVVTMLCKNSLKNEILQKHIQAQLNTELKLILASKTRCISLPKIIKTFVRVENESEMFLWRL